jgi:phospholipid/cholesterol/gamma-HCH transport system substrate-binding protein
MKPSGRNGWKLGLFVSLTAALFISGIYFVGNRQQLFSSTFKVSGIFRTIDGLQVGNNVRFSGINVGVIQAIEQISDSTVEVDMLINEHSRRFIKKNAKAIIGSDGLMGNKIMLITPGTSGEPIIANNDFIATSRPINMDEILLKVKVTSDNAAAITDNLAVITTSIREGKGTIGKLFMDSVFAETVGQALINIKQGAGGFKQNMDAASHNFLFRKFTRKKENEKK